MTRVTNRPFFSVEVLVIAALVILGGVLISHGLVAAFTRLLF